MIFRELVDLSAGGPEAVDSFVNRMNLRRAESSAGVAGIVSQILEDLRAVAEADRATVVLNYTRRFDATNAGQDLELFVSDAELDSANIDPRFEKAIDESILRVRSFHESQLSALTAGMAKSDSGFFWSKPAGESDSGYEGQRLVSVRTAGVYVPGGKATYPSSVIMNAVPALVAGVENIVLATPPRSDGSIAPAVLVAAKKLGIRTIIKAGGAYAIGAMAMGVQGAPPCDVIVGPGNVYVNEAKRQLWGQVGLDGYAGPSEVVVYADGSVPAAFSAADLLTQVEHAEDNFGCLVISDANVLASISDQIEKQLQGAKRESTMRSALSDLGLAIIVSDPNNAVKVIDAIAPEHISLHIEGAEDVARRIRNSGCILIGPYSAQSAGDFCAGPSHTLPTSSAGRFGGPVNVMTFMKFSSVSRLSRSDLAGMTTTIEAFGDLEGFPTHGQGATIRFAEI